MNEEYFFSGYCRAMDGSRTVTVETEAGKVLPDCDYDICPWASACPIGQQIEQL